MNPGALALPFRASKSLASWTLVLALLVIGTCIYRYGTPLWKCEQLYLQQAQAFTQGHLSIETADFDAAVYEGKHYVAYPPTPALIFTPLVAVFGPKIWIAYVLCLAALALTVGLSIQCARLAGADETLSAWFAGALAMGTGLWFCAEHSFSAAYNAHVFAMLFGMLALREALGSGRAWLAGLWLSAAFTCRPFMVTLGILVLVLLCDRSKIRSFRECFPFVLRMAAGALPLVLFSLGFNYFRFGNPFDTGYRYIQDPLSAGKPLFDLSYLPRNLYILFLRGPNLDLLLDPETLKPGATLNIGYSSANWGTSLFFASPFLLLAFLAPWKNLLTKAAWASVVLGLIPISLYIFTGRLQLGCARYTIDILPELALLVLWGLRARPEARAVFKPFVILAIVLNILFLTPLLERAVESYLSWVI
jgi:hypothetical protein